MLKETIKNIYGSIFFTLFSKLQLQKKIVFCSYWGLEYAGNPKCISEYMLENNAEFQQVWINHTNQSFGLDNRIKEVKWGTLGMIYELATAKVWVDDHTKPEWIKKRRDQFYIDIWHGGIGMKKIEIDAADKLSEQSLKNISHNSSIVDIFISNSQFFTDIIRRAFRYSGEILECGHPKNDIYYSSQEEKNSITDRVYDSLGIDSDKKIVLYVPTFRNIQNRDTRNLDFKSVIECLNKRFGNNYIMLIRPHPRDKHLFDEVTGNNIIVVNDYSSEELLIACDSIITDYSSTIFSALSTGKKGFIFASDLKEYEEERGLYYDLRSLPFPVAESMAELLANISNFDEKTYKIKLQEAIIRFGLKERGDATKIICGNIVKVLKTI